MEQKIEYRLKSRICQIAGGIAGTTMPLPLSRTVSVKVAASLPQFQIQPRVRSEKNRKERTVMVMIMINPVRWYKLYCRGLAVVDGYFAFDLVSETPDGLVTVQVVDRDPARPDEFYARKVTVCLPSGI